MRKWFINYVIKLAVCSSDDAQSRSCSIRGDDASLGTDILCPFHGEDKAIL